MAKLAVGDGGDFEKGENQDKDTGNVGNDFEKGENHVENTGNVGNLGDGWNPEAFSREELEEGHEDADEDSVEAKCSSKKFQKSHFGLIKKENRYCFLSDVFLALRSVNFAR